MFRRINLTLILLICLTGTLPSTAFSAVWNVNAQWDEAAEQRYSQWVEANFDAEFFYRDTPYENIATDCADAAYGMRMVFAFENRLPFAIRQPGDASRLITQASTQFDHLPAGLPRFRAFLNWVMAITNTATLVHDTYPVRIDRKQIRPGIIYLTWRTHAMQIVSVTPSGVIRYLESTAPRAVRPMRAILGFPHQVPADPRAARHGDGFRRFKTPQDYGKPEQTLAGYGSEQFERAREFQRESLPYYDWVQLQLATEPESLADRARRSVFAVCELTYDRASAIEETQDLLRDLRRQGRRCLSPAERDEHSTPTRDRLLLASFQYLERLTHHEDWPSLKSRHRSFIDLILGAARDDDSDNASAHSRAAFRQWCDVGELDGGPGRSMDLVEVFQLLRDQRMSANPHASLLERWGIPGATAAAGSRCP